MAIIEFDNYKSRLVELKPLLDEIRGSLDLENTKRRIAEMDRQMEETGFWNDPVSSARIVKDANRLKSSADKYEKLERSYEDIETLIEMGREEDDPETADEVREELDRFTAELEEERTALLLSEEYDHNNAIVALTAGAGGVEAMDFNEMLYRMYMRWCERHGMKMRLMDYQPGDEAGIKGVTFTVEGENAYGLLKSEMGVHRLVRISPFNAQGKRQTSFCAAEVMPELDDTIEIDIDPSDLEIDTYRSSGAGGQHINKTSSAVRIRHIPTGIVTACQEERSQFQNKDKAMAMLKARLFKLMQDEHAEKLSDIRGEVKEIAWGSQIRNYVLQPYTMVKDTRTGEETGNAQAVLDGDIDQFISAYLKWLKLGKPDRRAGDAE